MSVFRKRRLAEPPSLSPAERLSAALECMAYGLELHASGLRSRHPHLDAESIEEMLTAYLQADEPADPALRRRTLPLGT